MKTDKPTLVLMGALREMIRDRDYVYVSKHNPTYSHLTDDGRIVAMELIEQVIPMIIAADQARAKEEAEELMMNTLSGKDN